MKKSLVALAVLAASGASFAQSTVTLYGQADIFLGSSSTTGTPTQTVLNDGGVGQSRFGFKGSEDLGGGLKANFLLEQGFDISTGVAASAGFNRYSYVGFSGGFGEVRLGRVGTAYDDLNGNGHDVWDSALSSNGNVWLGYAGTGNNEIYYASNNYSGFSGAVSYTLGENKDTPNPGEPSSVTSLHVKYAAGPLYVGLGYQVEKAQAGLTLVTPAVAATLTTPAVAAVYSASPDLKSTRVNASYDFGVAKLVGDVGHVTKGSKTANEWTIGGYLPVSTALSLSAGFSKSTDNGVAGDQDKKGYGLGALYSLSKRTSVYGGFNRNTTTANVGGAETVSKTTAVGVLHTF